MVEVTVQSLGVDQSTKTPVVILQERGGSRGLPIWIGAAEAHAIAMELAGMKFSRPLTHDLMATLLRGLGGALDRVVISRVKENTYFAELIISRGAELFSVDARPSDSIALALRVSGRIFTGEDLLVDAAIELGSAPPASAIDEHPSAGDDDSPLTPEQLQAYLRKLGPEDLGRFNP